MSSSVKPFAFYSNDADGVPVRPMVPLIEGGA